MKMAAIYARVSSEQQREERTIASQTAALIEFAKSHDLEVPREWVFEDEGYSGASLERPGLERIRDLAAEGQIQAVLVHAPDRLSRKYAYQVLLIEEFARQGVETLFVKAPQSTSPEDQLLIQFQGMIAEYERAQILERSRRGKRHRARSGEVSVLSGAPYGYRYISEGVGAAGRTQERGADGGAGATGTGAFGTPVDASPGGRSAVERRGDVGGGGQGSAAPTGARGSAGVLDFGRYGFPEEG
jgi:DNA invertase Pin-like site-specific DNA recombinase